MVKTSRDSFLKVKEVETDLVAISLLSESGLTAQEVKNAVIKSNDIMSTASEIDALIISLLPY